MSYAKKNYTDLTPEELIGLIGQPVYVGVTEQATGATVYQAIGLVLNIQSDENSNRVLVSMSDGDKPTEISYTTDTYDGLFVWETFD